MHKNPVNLAFRFILEVSALTAMGMWGWQLLNNRIRYLLVWAIPVLAATIWGVFAVPGDPSRSGKAPVPVHGGIRLALELVFFAFATFLLCQLHFTNFGALMGIAVVLHYLVSYKRILWLVRQKGGRNKKS